MAKKQTYYLLSYSWYEDYDPTILKGPAVDDWQKYCDSLLAQVVSNITKRAVRKLKKTGSYDWIGIPNIVEGLIRVLKNNGYEIIKFPEATYRGGSILRSDHDFSEEIKSCISEKQQKEIMSYNKMISNILYKKIDFDDDDDLSSSSVDDES